MREHRPAIVRCAGPCGEDVSARDAREAVVSWSKSNSGDGTMTSPAAILRTKVYVCKKCFDQRLEPSRLPAELHILAERLGVIAREVLHFLIPSRDRPRNLFGEEMRRVG